jgi:uncharacterized protein YutE (UPF0331/DUF86 family)
MVMLDKNLLLTRLEDIDKPLEKISPLSKLTYQEFLNDTTAQDIVEYNLFQIINHLITITQHIVVDEDYGLPQTSYEASQILFDKGILGSADLDLMKKMIGFRNIVGHNYLNINKEVVYFILTSGQQNIRKILSHIIIKFL